MASKSCSTVPWLAACEAATVLAPTQEWRVCVVAWPQDREAMMGFMLMPCGSGGDCPAATDVGLPQEEPLQVLMRDQYGNYVVQKVGPRCGLRQAPRWCNGLSTLAWEVHAMMHWPQGG